MNIKALKAFARQLHKAADQDDDVAADREDYGYHPDDEYIEGDPDPTEQAGPGIRNMGTNNGWTIWHSPYFGKDRNRGDLWWLSVEGDVTFDHRFESERECREYARNNAPEAYIPEDERDEDEDAAAERELTSGHALETERWDDES